MDLPDDVRSFLADIASFILNGEDDGTNTPFMVEADDARDTVYSITQLARALCLKYGVGFEAAHGGALISFIIGSRA